MRYLPLIFFVIFITHSKQTKKTWVYFPKGHFTVSNDGYTIEKAEVANKSKGVCMSTDVGWDKGIHKWSIFVKVSSAPCIGICTIPEACKKQINRL